LIKKPLLLRGTETPGSSSERETMGESIFKKRAGIEKQVEEFMDRVSEAGP
jgi:hypothetical protein